MRARVCLSLVTLSLVASPAQAADVVIFGDSWAEFTGGELQSALSRGDRTAGLTTDNVGLGGTTAEMYANTDPLALSNALDANPDARWVYVSIGGNDQIAFHENGRGSETVPENTLNITQILDDALMRHPDVRFVMFGYDYVNWVQSQECLDTATRFWGTTDTRAINDIIEGQMEAAMTAAADSFKNATYVPLWGAMQLGAGVEGAPTPELPTPPELLRDCFHPNDAGFAFVHDALVAAYFDVPNPVAAIASDTDTFCAGNTQRFVSQGDDTTAYWWEYDGAPVGIGPQITVTLEAGTHTVRLFALNGGYEDQAEQTIEVSSDCPDAGTPFDAGLPPPVDAGSAPDGGLARDAGGDGSGGEVPDDDEEGGCVAGTGEVLLAPWLALGALIARRRRGSRVRPRRAR